MRQLKEYQFRTK